MLKRIIALSVIFVCSWVGWLILTYVVTVRTNESKNAMTGEVGLLWGNEQTQEAPAITAVWRVTERRDVVRTDKKWEFVKETPGDSALGTGLDQQPLVEVNPADVCVGGALDTTTISQEVLVTEVVGKREWQPEEKKYKKVKTEKGIEVSVLEHSCKLPLASTDVEVLLEVDHRKRGLLWFATYGVDFDSQYSIENPFDHLIDITISIPLPGSDAIYDNMYLVADDGDAMNSKPESGKMVGRLSLSPKLKRAFKFGYKSRGMDRWGYRFGDGVQYVENFNLEMTTNFDAVDYPVGTMSPDRLKKHGAKPGWSLTWAKESVVSGLNVGMIMPERINPGPLAASMNVHAPVSLFFFFFVIFILQVLRSLRLHPMHYFFLAASFFAFNLLFSYLVNHLSIVPSFVIASGVSVFLVVTYMRLVVSTRFALIEVAGSQLLYQVLFSMAHFWEGYTGLTVTIGAILTLAVVMQMTAKVNWDAAFKGSKRAEQKSRMD